MEAPRYLNSLELVAKKSGGMADLRILGQSITDAWYALESTAQGRGYDILSQDFPLGYLEHLAYLLYRVPGANWELDCRTLRAKDKDYGGSWHRRGGQGAFMMLARKWDRIENALKNVGNLQVVWENDNRAEGVADDIADLRCYILLVLSWHQERNEPTPVPSQEMMF